MTIVDSFRFLNGSFFKKKVDYSHGFSSVFLRSPEVTKIVLPKVLQNFEKTPNCTCWPKELNQKDSRVTYNTGRDRRDPSLDVFRHCTTFFQIFFPTRGPPFNVEWMLKNPKESSLSVFSAL